MKKKLLSILAIFVIAIFAVVSVNAATDEENKENDFSLFNVNSFSEVYKLSEQNGKIDIPFINIFSKGATYDKIVKHPGISIGSSTIDVNEKLEGLQLIISNDMISIKGEVENVIIFGKNVVVEGSISGDSVIFSENVTVTEKGKIASDVVIISNELEISGTVEGNLIAVVSGKSKINGTINGEYRTITGSIDVENSNIKGNVYIKTNADTSKVLEKYKNATIVAIKNEDSKDTGKEILDIVIKGIITVVIYTLVCFLITKKDNNIVAKMTNKFKEHTVYGIIMACIYLFVSLILPVILILLAVAGLGIVAWPILIVYLAILLISLSMSTLIVGMIIYEALKDKIEKYKLPAMAGIFIVLFVLSNIPAISHYALTTINLVSLAAIITLLTKRKNKKEEKPQK